METNLLMQVFLVQKSRQLARHLAELAIEWENEIEAAKTHGVIFQNAHQL